MGDEHREHISQARELLELAAQTPEGRAGLRGWLAQVMRALGQEDPAQDVPASQDGTTAWNRRALARSGIELALSATGDEPEVLCLAEDESTGGAHDNGGQDMPNGTASWEDAWEALARDEVDRYAFMVQGGGLRRPSYGGTAVQLSEPASPDELDDADVTAATMELAARTGGRASFADVADAVDELALSRDPEMAGTASGRAAALVELAGLVPGGDDPDALELARRREVSRLSGAQDDEALELARRDPYNEPPSGQKARESTQARIAELVRRNPEILSDQPRGRQLPVHVTVAYGPAEEAVGVPRRGGAVHPEVERLLRQYGLNPEVPRPSSNAMHPVKSAAQREREQQRAEGGRPGGLFGIEELHRAAMRSAHSSRG